MLEVVLMEEAIERVKPFMYRNARPIDLARWQFHFENGSEENVIRCLAYYQNEDGGFGHALEADAWNPNSSPIQTWAATEILREIQLTDSCHPIIKGILRYLESEKDFTGRVWLNTIKSNNDYPHAPWWTAGENYLEDNNDNPTACLAGFILRFADKESPLYALGHRISGEVIDSYLQQDEPPEMHLLSCYIRLVQYIEEADLADDFDITALKSKLKEDVTKTITSDTAEWASGYICKPSQFFNHKSSMFYKDNQKTADFEYQYIIETQQEDGTWQIPWGWPEYANKWAISENWWKANVVITNLFYLRGMK